MFAHLLSAFSGLFATRRGQLTVAALVVATAAVPVLEILALRLFSDLVVEGPRRFAQDPWGAAPTVVVFVSAFVLTRVAHHAIRLVRVRVYREGFAASNRSSSPSQESWEWAQAFELTSVVTALVQCAMFSVLFLVVDPVTGLATLLVSAVVLAAVSSLFARQLALQRQYVSDGPGAGSVAIAERVGGRLRAAELGAVVTSAGVLGVVLLLLVRTLGGEVTSADAIVLFLGLRLHSGQLSGLSASMMRFARASARRGGP